MTNRRQLPKTPTPANHRERKDFDDTMKKIVEEITGARGRKIAVLPAGATLEQLRHKINELITLLQSTE